MAAMALTTSTNQTLVAAVAAAIAVPAVTVAQVLRQRRAGQVGRVPTTITDWAATNSEEAAAAGLKSRVVAASVAEVLEAAALVTVLLAR
jgi:hypothetical protein